MRITLKKYSTLFFLSLLLLTNFNAQNNSDSNSNQNHISGKLINLKTKAPLPYANVLLQQQNKGGITNEQGYFSINTDVVDVNDTLVFLYIGYQTKKIALVDFKLNSIVSLKEETFNLNETFVFANEFNVKEIIKKVANNIENNYKPLSLKQQLFIR